METKLKLFRVWRLTKFGIGCFEKKAKSFDDCLKRLSNSDLKFTTRIEDLETDEEHYVENGQLFPTN
jgi:hypothetical protein